jgi:hypothetical protein
VAVDGDLKDMSLASLVQTLCLEQRKTMLVLKRRRMEEGIILFDGGEIVHAATGSLSGEEAVYQLLGWTDGTFRQSDHVTVPRRTIAMPWKHLLLEGMKRIDHQETADVTPAQIERPLSPAEVERDNTLENDLILLLSQLEHLRAQVADRKARGRPPLALQALTEMLNQAASFSEGLNAKANANSLARALTLASELHPAARLLRTQDNRLSLQTVSKLYSSWADDPTGRREVFYQIGQAMLDVLESYFMLFTGSFRAPSLANQWRETCRVFLTDLTQVVETIRF